MPDTKKGPWTLQQVRDQILKDCWSYSAVDPGVGTSGSLWVRGVNGSGQLGLSDTISRSLPVQIPGNWLSDCRAFCSSEGVSGAIDSSYRLYMWGANPSGQLGLSDTVNRSSPVQIPGTIWCSLVLPEWTLSNNTGIHALKTDNTLWGWGQNSYGGIGNNVSQGTVAAYSSPVQIPGTTWVCIRRSQHSLALKSDYSMWTWGRNYDGQLGILLRGPFNNRSSPVQLPGSWCEIATGWPISLAIKTDGTMWGWGGNHYSGIAGLNDVIDRSSPIQIPGTWSKVFSNSTGYTTRSGAIKTTDSCLYMWGVNSSGQLGLNDSITRSSPVVLPGSWSCIFGGGVTTVGKRTDNTIWAWGANNYGQYNVDKVAYSSPIQVPGSWVTATGVGSTLFYVC